MRDMVLGHAHARPMVLGKFEAAAVLLRCIAFGATFLVARQLSAITVLGPLYAIRMVGSVVAVRYPAARSRHAAAYQVLSLCGGG